MEKNIRFFKVFIDTELYFLTLNKNTCFLNRAVHLLEHRVQFYTYTTRDICQCDFFKIRHFQGLRVQNTKFIECVMTNCEIYEMSVHFLRCDMGDVYTTQDFSK